MLSHPRMHERIEGLHAVGTALVGVLAPGSASLVPASPAVRCAAALLLLWLAVGRLLLTLAVLPRWRRRAAAAGGVGVGDDGLGGGWDGQAELSVLRALQTSRGASRGDQRRHIAHRLLPAPCGGA